MAKKRKAGEVDNEADKSSKKKLEKKVQCNKRKYNCSFTEK